MRRLELLEWQAISTAHVNLEASDHGPVTPAEAETAVCLSPTGHLSPKTSAQFLQSQCLDQTLSNAKTSIIAFLDWNEVWLPLI